MFTKSRKVVALGTGLDRRAYRRRDRRHATGADLNDAAVVGKVTPNKLDKKDFKPVALFLGVENSPDSTGNEDANAAAELIHISKNIKIDLKNTPICEVELANGTPTDVARDICPGRSYIGKGDAEVHAPGPCRLATYPPQTDPPCVVAEPVVSVFHGPDAERAPAPHLQPGSRRGFARRRRGDRQVRRERLRLRRSACPKLLSTGASEDHRVQRGALQGLEGREGQVRSEGVQVPASR